ncbi:hypothetical protein A3860_37850 [Niastella vici]|uniref:Lipoprotein n=1 Tax=Niastella vici TaxID=1703345 RepID=A0A1V9FM51_9BACT|nr:hypothetical protein [Niastella vici]OQP59424.1 hypothetical protein A3860_37850 [Niastella vici]
MRYLTTVAIFSITLFASCNNGADKSLNYSLRDSITKKHLESFGSSIYSDTSDINYKVLKAYVVNDTSFFKKLNAEMEKGQKVKQQLENNDSCIHQLSLQNLGADEAYRFVFSEAFCQYKLNVTISRTADNSNIHFIILQDVWLHDTCKVINEYNRKITAQDWDNFSRLMDEADFWGLKSNNGVMGLDGSDLVTTGFKRHRTYDRKPKFNCVYRWGPSTLSIPFHFVLKLSGNTQGCVVVR